MKQTIFILTFILFTGFGIAQCRTVTGTVTSKTDHMTMPGVSVVVKGTSGGVQTDFDGKYAIQVSDSTSVLVFSFLGSKTKHVKVGKRKIIDVSLEDETTMLSNVVVEGYRSTKIKLTSNVASKARRVEPRYNTEDYSAVEENIFLAVKNKPLSTFSIDVDNASYSNVRRYLNMGQMPPKDAVRTEELINYFHYDYPGPEGDDPVAIHTETVSCPWNNNHQLVKIGLQARKIEAEKLPASNLVFLIDVSGSMNQENKLPLLKSAFKLLTNQLRPQDKVAIVVYAGSAGVVLPSTKGSDKIKILDALENLQAGGSTAGGQGIELAYKIASENFIEGGNNRVILATDGDFNVGVSSDGGLKDLIESKRKSGVFLSVLGFGMGNYKDNKLELLADKGNGNYAYIDTFEEAKKVFGKEFGGTLFTVAKDVKLQVEFNPNFVQGYRLIGYENRKLNDEDFNDDKKDAGEMGAGHTVTAFYEIIPVGIKDPMLKEIDPLKYQSASKSTENNSEMLNVKLRYKEPTKNKSKLLEKAVVKEIKSFETASENFRFAAAVASFGMLLRNSEFKGDSTYDQILNMAQNAKGPDMEGYRTEFIKLIKTAIELNKNKSELGQK